MKKCEGVFKKVPVVKKLWDDLGDNVNSEDPVFSTITQTLQLILGKT